MAASSRTDVSKWPYRPANLIDGRRGIVLLVAAALAVPLLLYVLLPRHGLFAAVGFVVALPLVALNRPRVAAMVLTPIIVVVLLTDNFAHVAQPAIGGVLAGLVLGIFAHAMNGKARLGRDIPRSPYWWQHSQ